MTPTVWPTRGVGSVRRQTTCEGRRSTSPAVPPLTGDAAFHCQQAAEKTLKALLAWHDVPFRKTHDLAEIGQRCTTLDISLEPLCRRAERLTIFAWIFRSPGDLEDPPVEEVVEALAVVRDVHNAVLARLPTEVWSRA